MNLRCILYISYIIVQTLVLASQNGKKTILVFGGTGNIGTEVVNLLLKSGYKPTLVSRGGWRFDSGTLIRPKVRHIPCDRYAEPGNPLKRCEELMNFISDTELFDFVIDFSAFRGEAAAHAVEVLGNKVGLYIYISSDSVYEVCKPGDSPTKETDAIRPEDEEEQKLLNGEDTYGHLKLQVEEVLKKQREDGGFPYMFLRLPDVIGPRDTTQRWWPLQLWIKHYHIIERPIVLDHSLENTTTSLVYTKDIAKAIKAAMEAGEIVHDNAYNIGFDQQFKYSDIIKAIADELKIKDIEFDETYSGRQFYPSVKRGPLNTTKIKEHLGFKPTSWKYAIKNTVAWHERASHEYFEHFSFMVDILVNQIVPDENVEAFQNAVKKKIKHMEL